MEGVNLFVLSDLTTTLGFVQSTLCITSLFVGFAVEAISGTVYGSKEELIKAGLHQSSADAYCKDSHVFSVLSGTSRSCLSVAVQPQLLLGCQAKLQVGFKVQSRGWSHMQVDGVVAIRTWVACCRRTSVTFWCIVLVSCHHQLYIT